MIKSTFVYLVGGIFNRAIPFFLLPVLTRFLAPEEYGVLAIFQVLLSFTTPLVGMNMHTNISRNFAKMGRDAIARLIGTLSGLLCVSAGLLGLLAAGWVIFHGPILGISGGWLLALPLIAAFNMAHQYNLTVLRNQERPVIFGAFDLGNTILNLLVSVLLVVGLGFGWQGRAIGIAVAAICFGLVGLASLRQQNLVVFKFDKGLVKEVLLISLPLIPHAVGGAVIAMSDRLFIDRMVGKEAVGLYAVGYTFGMTMNLVVDAFNRAWGPWFYREMAKITEEKSQRIVKFTYVYFVGALLLAVLVAGFSYLIMPYMVAPEYQAAVKFVLWVSLGYAFRGMYTMVFPYLVHAAKTNFLAILTVTSAVVNLFLNFILIKLYGAIGAAQATLISFVISFLGTWWYANRVCPMPWGLWYRKIFAKSF